MAHPPLDDQSRVLLDVVQRLVNAVHEEAEAYLATRYGKLSPVQRIEMACGMWTTAVTMARAGSGNAAAWLGESEQRVLLLERLDADDLDPAVMSALIARLRRGCVPGA